MWLGRRRRVGAHTGGLGMAVGSHPNGPTLSLAYDVICLFRWVTPSPFPLGPYAYRHTPLSLSVVSVLSTSCSRLSGAIISTPQPQCTNRSELPPSQEKKPSQRSREREPCGRSAPAQSFYPTLATGACDASLNCDPLLPPNNALSSQLDHCTIVSSISPSRPALVA